MSFLCKHNKHFILSSYLLKLPKPLAQAFGKSDFYTPAQVRTCLSQLKLNKTYDCYAYAMYCEKVDYDTYINSLDAQSISKQGKCFTYDMLRHEIGELFFQNNSKFRMQHIERFDPSNSALPPGNEINENVNA